MKIIKKLKALFFKDEEPVSPDLVDAQIKEGRALLHPKDDLNVTYCVKSDDIEIRLSQGKSLTDTDIMVIKKIRKREKNTTRQKDRLLNTKKEKQDFHNDTSSNSHTDDFSRFKKRTFFVSLYPEEYDALMEMIQKYGYKRSEFILASAQTATQGTMAKAQRKVMMVRKEIRKEEKELKSKHKSNVTPQ